MNIYQYSKKNVAGCDRSRTLEKNRGMLRYLSKQQPTMPFVHAYVAFVIYQKWKDNIVRVNSNNPRLAQLVMNIA